MELQYYALNSITTVYHPYRNYNKTDYMEETKKIVYYGYQRVVQNTINKRMVSLMLGRLEI